MTDNHAASVRNAIVCLDAVMERMDAGEDVMILEEAQAILSDYEEQL
jgi:hypothetical protein